MKWWVKNCGLNNCTHWHPWQVEVWASAGLWLWNFVEADFGQEVNSEVNLYLAGYWEFLSDHKSNNEFPVTKE